MIRLGPHDETSPVGHVNAQAPSRDCLIAGPGDDRLIHHRYRSLEALRHGGSLALNEARAFHAPYVSGSGAVPQQLWLSRNNPSVRQMRFEISQERDALSAYPVGPRRRLSSSRAQVRRLDNTPFSYSPDKVSSMSVRRSVGECLGLGQLPGPSWSTESNSVTEGSDSAHSGVLPGWRE